MPSSNDKTGGRIGRTPRGDRRESRFVRRGFAVMEAVVAAGVVLLLLSVITPAVIRSARVWKQTRHFQFACDELSSQMDRLVALDSEKRKMAIESLQLSIETLEVLGDASLDGELIADDSGSRLLLSINWQRQGDPPPVRLMAWLNTMGGEDPSVGETTESSGETTEDQPDADSTDSATSTEGDQ